MNIIKGGTGHAKPTGVSQAEIDRL